jgi:dTMP kinase
MFISVEGLDGVGKTTFAKLLSEKLSKIGCDNIITSEPGGDGSSKMQHCLDIKKLFISNISILDNVSRLLLINAARRENIEKIIKPSLEKEKVVICDRFIDSTIAYQHFYEGLDLDKILDAHKLFCDNLEPDITILLDISTDKAIDMMKGRADNNQLDYLNKSQRELIRSGFIFCKNSIFKNRYYVTVADHSDCDMAIEKILSYIGNA